MNRMASDGAVQVHDVEKLRALLRPMFSRLYRVVKIDGLLIHFPLIKSDATAILDVDGGDNEHRLSLLYESCEVSQNAKPDLLTLFWVKLAGQEMVCRNTRNEGSPVDCRGCR